MLDTLLSRLKDEIAIDGTSGSSIDTVWTYAESISNQVAKQSNISITPKIDGPYKAFIWNYIKQEPELEFFEEVATPADENQANDSQDVPMEEQPEAAVDQDQHVVAMKQEETAEQDENVVAMEAVFDDNDTTTAATSEADPSENQLIDMLQEAQEKDRELEAAMYRKRKSTAAVKKSAPKKKKMRSAPKKKQKKQKKKPAKKKKKRACAGHSDSDFEMDSDDSESEFDASDLSEVSSEEYSTEGDEDVSDQDEYAKPDYVKKFTVKRKREDISSHPRNIQQQTNKGNAGLTAIPDIADLSYDQVQERYGPRLRIIASARLQDEQLYIGVPPDANITPSLVVILKEILKTRTKGLYQASITRLLDLDSRSTGHYAKALEDKGAITRRGVSINSMYTNICVHARFSVESNEVDMNTVGDRETENELPYNVNGHGKVFSQKALLDAMVDLALAAPNGLILSQDVLHGLGFNSTRTSVRKWFNRSIDELCVKGYFEKASIKLDGSRHHRCLQLIKVPEDYEARQASNEQPIVPVDELSFPIKIKTTKNQGIPIHHLLCDVPLESQVLDVVTAAGIHGVVQKDIAIALNMDEMRFLSKALEKIAELKPGQGYEQYGIMRYLEFEGRVRRYRYFTLAASIKVNEDRDYVPPPLPDTEVDESKYYERTIFYPVPHTVSHLSRYRKMVKKLGHRNVCFKDGLPPTFRIRTLYNPDGTIRPKSRYILKKEKKIAEMIAAEKAAEKAAAEGRATTPSSDDLPPISRYMLQKEKRLAAEKAAAEGGASTSIAEPSATAESSSTAEPSSTTAPADQPRQAPPARTIHSFFQSCKEARIRKSDMHLLTRPPSPTPTPAPVISENRLACPASGEKPRAPVPVSQPKAVPVSQPKAVPEPKAKARAAPIAETPVSEPPARKKRKYTKKSQVPVAQQVASISEAEAESTGSRTTRSGRVIPYLVKPAPSEPSSESPVAPASQGPTEMDTSEPALSEPAEPESRTATAEPEAPTAESPAPAPAPATQPEAPVSESQPEPALSEPAESESHTATAEPEAPTAESPALATQPEAPTAESPAPATQPEAPVSESQPQSSSPPAATAPSGTKPKRSTSQVPAKAHQSRLRNRSIADFFKLVPKKTAPSVAANPPTEASSSAANPPTEASSSAANPPKEASSSSASPLPVEASSSAVSSLPVEASSAASSILVEASSSEASSLLAEASTSEAASSLPVEDSTSETPPLPIETASTKAKAKGTKTVSFAKSVTEPALESEKSSASQVTEAEASVSKDDMEETTATDNEGTAQADVADMEVDNPEPSRPAVESTQVTRVTRSRSNTTTPAPAPAPAPEEGEVEGEQNQALTITTTATTTQEPRLFRRYQHEKTQKPMNSYLEARIKILYEMLEEVRLVEMGKGFLQEFVDKVAEQNKSNKYKMDGKTLWTTGLELEKRGQAQTAVIECTFLSGKTVKRKVIFHRDMSQNSEEFKNYISFIKERRTGISYRNLPKPVAQVDQVVRLSDQVEQMQKEAQELLVSGQVKKAKQLELRISELSQNLQTFGRTYGERSSTYWMIEATQYGWISASMARAKILHRYLFHLLEANVDGADQETRLISLNAVVDNMTLQLFTQIIGVFRPSRLIAEYYKDPKNHKVRMADMTDEMKLEMFDGHTKFLRRLKKLFNCLEFVQIVAGQFTEVKNNPNFKATKYGHIAPIYRLEKEVPVIDRRQASEPVLRVHTIETLEDLHEYWSDLKYVCSRRNTVQGPLKKLDDPYEAELRSSFHSPRNWSTRSTFTRSQRKLLNEKVDKANRKTPLDDMDEIRAMAFKLDTTAYAVQSYYEKVEAALERRFRYSKQQKLEALLMGRHKRRKVNQSKYNIYSGRRVITGDSNHAFVGPRRQPSKARKTYLDDLQDLPEVQDDALKSLVRRRRKRSTWTEQDDEVLLYMFTILRHRSRMNRAKLSWNPAAQVFPDREPQNCRHRKDRMMGQSKFSEKYELYLVYWDTFYREGIANGDITDPRPHDNTKVDVLSYIEYFIQRLQELDVHPVDLPLPATLAETRDTYDIVRNETSSPYFEDIFHDGESLVHKLQSLYQAPLTLRTYMDSHYDQLDAVTAIEDDADSRLCSLIRIYCLMTLMTPAEVFDPFHAYQILSRFPSPLMDVVYERMKNDKTLISANGDRPIPGTKWALSAKFIKDMGGELPIDLFNQAKEYEKFLATQNEKFKFMPHHASSGMMACLLNALSNHQVSFGLTNLSLQMRKVNEVGYKTRGLGTSILTQLGVDIQRNSQADQEMADVPTASKVFIKQLTNKEYDATLSNLLISQSDKESAVLKAVIHALHEQHDVGLTLYQLKAKLQEHHHHHFTDQDIVMAVRKLCYNTPALVCQVGFDAVRYVHVKFVDSWTINNKAAKDHKFSDTVKQEVMSQTNGQFQVDIVKKDNVIPSLWIDINGNVTELVLNGCKKAIVDLVIRKPGISEAEIHRHMSRGLSKREVHDVLDILVEQQALKRLQVQTVPQQQAKRSSIFAQKTAVKCSSGDSIGKLTHSCFWATPKIFLSTV